MPANASHPEAAEALWLVPVLALAKGLQMFAKVLPIFRQVIGLLTLLIILAEDAMGPGTGAQKKQKVIDDFKAWFFHLAGELSIPAWIVGLVTTDAILGLLIDFLVAAFNKLEDWPGLKPAAPAQAALAAGTPPLAV